MTSILKVDNIQNSSGTSAMSIDSSGNVTTTNPIVMTGRPAFGVRGTASRTSLTAAASYFDYVTSWTTTDFDQGNLLDSGYAEVPTGYSGIYQISFHVGWVSSVNYTSAYLYWYDLSATTYKKIYGDYSANDYNGYSTGRTVLLDLDVGDKIYAGFDDRYGLPDTSDNETSFSMMYIG